MKKTSESVVELETLNDAALEDVTGGSFRPSGYSSGQYVGGGFSWNPTGGGSVSYGGFALNPTGGGGSISYGGFTLRY